MNFTELSQTDLQIKSMHSYLKNKLKPVAGLPPEKQELLDIVNQNSLEYFEMTFSQDLQRLGLINNTK